VSAGPISIPSIYTEWIKLHHIIIIGVADCEWPAHAQVARFTTKWKVPISYLLDGQVYSSESDVGRSFVLDQWINHKQILPSTLWLEHAIPQSDPWKMVYYEKTSVSLSYLTSGLPKEIPHHISATIILLITGENFFCDSSSISTIFQGCEPHSDSRTTKDHLSWNR